MHIEEIKVDYSKKWYVMASVAMGVFLATIDGSIVNVAMPTLVKDLNVDFSIVEWVILIYLLTVTILMLGIGRFADMIGKKKIYSTGFLVFTLGSVLCGLSPTVYWLIAFRVFQAIGASMMMALGTAIITEAFPPSERGMALGISGLMVSLGVITGPTIGGIILESASWHWLFFVNIPVGLIGILMVIRFVPSIKPRGGQVFDVMGSVLFFTSLISFLLALTTWQRTGLGPFILGLSVSWIVFLFLFVVHERRTKSPLIDLKLFNNGLFSVNLITGFITFILGSGTTLLMPFYLQNVLQHSPRTVGLLMATIPITVGIIGPISGWLSDRIGSRPLTVIGLGVLITGYLSISSLNESTNAIGFILRSIPVGLGIGIFQSPNNSAIMGAAPKDRLGVVSGLLAITRTLGQTTGTAAVAALWVSRVNFHAGSFLLETTSASKAIQVQGLQDTILVLVAILIPAFLLSLWALFKENLSRKTQKAIT